MTFPSPSWRPAQRGVPKIVGSDAELGNFVAGVDRIHGSGAEAVAALLRAFGGVAPGDRLAACACPSCRSRRERAWAGDAPWWGGGGYGYSYGYDPQDRERHWLPNGGCAYEDLTHLELCTPEVRRAEDFVAARHAMLGLAGDALRRANAERPPDRRIRLVANNSDGFGNSYGSHLSLLVSRACYDTIFHRKIHHQLYLASHLASAIVLGGAGKVGSENGRPAAAFQISQRADFMETLSGPQTTYRRPLVNCRDEPLCGSGCKSTRSDLARVHVIACDFSLAHTACYLMAGTLQLVLAMLEQRAVDLRLLLDDPLDAMLRWSHDPDLGATAELTEGGQYTAVDVQAELHERATAFVEAGGAEGVVPGAARLLALWGDTLDRLRRRDWAGLAPRLDWVLKRTLLERARERRGLAWDAPEMKHLDQIYGSLDPADGLYLACERRGAVERIASPAAVERFRSQPPEDTRAWLRGRLLDRLPDYDIAEIDWDRIRVRPRGGGAERPIHFPDPAGDGRAEHGPLFASDRTAEELVEALAAPEAPEADRSRPAAWCGAGALVRRATHAGRRDDDDS